MLGLLFSIQCLSFPFLPAAKRLVDSYNEAFEKEDVVWNRNILEAGQLYREWYQRWAVLTQVTQPDGFFVEIAAFFAFGSTNWDVFGSMRYGSDGAYVPLQLSFNTPIMVPINYG